MMVRRYAVSRSSSRPSAPAGRVDRLVDVVVGECQANATVGDGVGRQEDAGVEHGEAERFAADEVGVDGLAER